MPANNVIKSVPFPIMILFGITLITLGCCVCIGLAYPVIIVNEIVLSNEMIFLNSYNATVALLLCLIPTVALTLVSIGVTFLLQDR